VEESMNVKFQDFMQNRLNQTQLEESELTPDLTKSTSPEVVQTSEEQQQEEPMNLTEVKDQQTFKPTSNWKHKANHPKELIIGNIDEGICTKFKR